MQDGRAENVKWRQTRLQASKDGGEKNRERSQTELFHRKTFFPRLRGKYPRSGGWGRMQHTPSVHSHRFRDRAWTPPPQAGEEKRCAP